MAPSAAGFLLWAYALARMPAARATAAFYLVPAVAIVVSLVWLKEVPSAVELGGGVLTLAGVTVAARRQARPLRPACPPVADRADSEGKQPECKVPIGE